MKRNQLFDQKNDDYDWQAAVDKKKERLTAADRYNAFFVYMFFCTKCSEIPMNKERRECFFIKKP